MQIMCLASFSPYRVNHAMPVLSILPEPFISSILLKQNTISPQANVFEVSRSAYPIALLELPPARSGAELHRGLLFDAINEAFTPMAETPVNPQGRAYHYCRQGKLFACTLTTLSPEVRDKLGRLCACATSGHSPSRVGTTS
jgi:hypothetical protein